MAGRLPIDATPSAGITQFRFNGFDLSLLGTPSIQRYTGPAAASTLGTLDADRLEVDHVRRAKGRGAAESGVQPGG